MHAHHLRSREGAKSYSRRVDADYYGAERNPKEISHDQLFSTETPTKVRKPAASRRLDPLGGVSSVFNERLIFRRMAKGRLETD